MNHDLYAFTLPRAPDSQVDFACERFTEFYRWESRPDLHLWAARLYRHKGGVLRDFSRGHLFVLQWCDLNSLEQRVYLTGLVRHILPSWAPATTHHRATDLHFVVRAREVIACGLTVAIAAM